MSGYEHRECLNCQTEIGFNEAARKVEDGWLCSWCGEDKMPEQEDVSLHSVMGKLFGDSNETNP